MEFRSALGQSFSVSQLGGEKSKVHEEGLPRKNRWRLVVMVWD
jgi:hypothetical protein